MSFLRPRRGFAWLAIAVVACAALAPSMVRGFADASAAIALWNELCTAAGLKTAATPIPIERSDVGGGPAGTSAQECPLCLPNQLQYTPPAAPVRSVRPAADGTARFLLFFLGTAPTSDMRLPAQPRAPPALA